MRLQGCWASQERRSRCMLSGKPLPCVYLCSFFTDSLKLSGHPEISYSFLPTGSSCPLLHGQGGLWLFCLLSPLHQKVLLESLPRSWGIPGHTKSAAKGTKSRLAASHSLTTAGFQQLHTNLPSPQLHNEPPTLCCFWDEESFGNWYKGNKITPKPSPTPHPFTKRGKKAKLLAFPALSLVLSNPRYWQGIKEIAG